MSPSVIVESVRPNVGSAWVSYILLHMVLGVDCLMLMIDHVKGGDE